MAKYFLGSVGKAEAFRKNGDHLELVFVSKTLTQSGISISSNKDDIRAGEGAPVQFSFYSNASAEITLTDVIFERAYVEAQLGIKFEQNADSVEYHTETITAGAGGVITLADKVLELPIPCEGDFYGIWFSPVGRDDWKLGEVTVDGETQTVTLPGATQNSKYCVRYLRNNINAYMAEVKSTIIPHELFLVITAPIYSGDACAASKGQTAGTITFEVPRFQLNGQQDFSMEMSSNQTMSLSGTALSTTSEDCNSNAGKLLRIIEVITNENWYDDVEELIFDEETCVADTALGIYASKSNGELVKITKYDEFEAKLSTGTGYETLTADGLDAGTYSIRIKGKTSVEDTAVIIRAA